MNIGEKNLINVSLEVIYTGLGLFNLFWILKIFIDTEYWVWIWHTKHYESCTKTEQDTKSWHIEKTLNFVKYIVQPRLVIFVDF